MAVTILKKTPIHCVVKVSGAAGANSISLGTDLLYGSNEVANNPKVNIIGLHWSVPGATGATIVRNSATCWSLTGSFSLLFNGFADSQEQGSDIIVTLPSGGGSVILELLKVNGYGNTQHRNPQSGE